MKTYSSKKLVLASLLLGLSQTSWAACDQTLNPGANLASAIANASAGSTICLNSGNYGNVNVAGVSKSSPVTIQSASGVGATIGVYTLSSSNNLTFKNLTLSTLYWSGSENTNIKVLNSVFKGQMYVWGSGGKQNNIIDGNTFNGINVAGGGREGRLTIYGGGDLIVSNNKFGQQGCSDGIQIGGSGTVIGPGNVFDGLVQSVCPSTVHVDSIQQYGEVSNQTITGNYFINDTVCIGTYNNSVNSTVTNNVFVATDTNNMRCVIDYGSTTNLNFSHNTVKSYQVRFGSINENPGTTGVINDNIFLDNSFSRPGVGFSGTINHNLYTSNSIAIGTNSIIGTPSFVGGSGMSGYALQSNSIGYNSVGANVSGSTSVVTTPPTVSISAPSNFRLQ